MADICKLQRYAKNNLGYVLKIINVFFGKYYSFHALTYKTIVCTLWKKLNPRK
jgi:hypothetical protein